MPRPPPKHHAHAQPHLQPPVLYPPPHAAARAAPPPPPPPVRPDAPIGSDFPAAAAGRALQRRGTEDSLLTSSSQHEGEEGEGGVARSSRR